MLVEGMSTMTRMALAAATAVPFIVEMLTFIGNALIVFNVLMACYQLGEIHRLLLRLDAGPGRARRARRERRAEAGFAGPTEIGDKGVTEAEPRP